MGAHGIQVDDKKVQAIRDWPTIHNVHELRSFHGLATFYRRFLRNFSSIVAPLTDCLRGGKFFWSVVQDHSFRHIKQLLTQAPVSALPNFDKVFKVETNASMTGIGAVLLQDGRTTYEQELFAIVRALQHWEYFLVHGEFVLHCDHHPLQFLDSKKRLGRMHARWVL